MEVSKAAFAPKAYPIQSPAKRVWIGKEKWRSGFALAQRDKAKGAEPTSTWPHGQVVKTAASHAVNVGSNPAGVTKKALDKGVERWYNDKCSRAEA